MGKIKKNSRGSRQKRRMRVHKRSMLAVGAVIILLTAVVSVSGMTLRAKEKSYKAQAAELEQQRTWPGRNWAWFIKMKRYSKQNSADTNDKL